MKKILLIIAISALTILSNCTTAQAPSDSASEPVSASEDAVNKTPSQAINAADTASSEPGDSASPEAAASPASNAAPRFEDYAVKEMYTGKRPPLKFTPKTAEFKTRLTAAAKDPPNFAGKYVVATWGCGTDCLMGGIINLETGNTYEIPFSICCVLENGDDGTNKVEIRKDSKLIIFNGLLNEEESESNQHFYLFEDDKLVEVAPK
jgi:hypothetical protein